MRGPGPKWQAKYQSQPGPSRHDPVEDTFPILHFHNP
jgi:hypothetical protein